MFGSFHAIFTTGNGIRGINGEYVEITIGSEACIDCRTGRRYNGLALRATVMGRSWSEKVVELCENSTVHTPYSPKNLKELTYKALSIIQDIQSPYKWRTGEDAMTLRRAMFAVSL